MLCVLISIYLAGPLENFPTFDLLNVDSLRVMVPQVWWSYVKKRAVRNGFLSAEEGAEWLEGQDLQP